MTEQEAKADDHSATPRWLWQIAVQKLQKTTQENKLFLKELFPFQTNMYPAVLAMLWSSSGCLLYLSKEGLKKIQWILPLLSATQQKGKVTKIWQCIVIHSVYQIWHHGTSGSSPKSKWPWKGNVKAAMTVSDTHERRCLELLQKVWRTSRYVCLHWGEIS